MAKEKVRVLTVSGMLGYGLDPEEVRKGLAKRPDVITADSGTTDDGPQKLGAGTTTCPIEAYCHDLEVVLEAGYETKSRFLSVQPEVTGPMPMSYVFGYYQGNIQSQRLSF